MELRLFQGKNPVTENNLKHQPSVQKSDALLATSAGLQKTECHISTEMKAKRNLP